MKRSLPLYAGSTFTLLLAAAAVFLYVEGRRNTPPPSPPTVVPAPRRRPVPPELAALHAEIRSLLGRREFAAALRLYPRFIDGLSSAWGAEDRDLAPFIYDFALAHKLAGKKLECLTITGKALRVWPHELQIQVLEATTRAELALGGSVPVGDTGDLFAEILKEENISRLKALRIDPAELFAQWARLTLRAGRNAEALAIASRGADASAGHTRCLETKAEALLSLHRHREAIAILGRLASTRPTPRLEFLLGTAYLESGDPAAALDRLQPLLERTAGASGAPGFRRALGLKVSNALNRVERFDEGAEIALDLLAGEPEDRELLQELARSARGLGAEEAAAALDRRIRELLPWESFLEAAKKARAAGERSSERYYRAVVSLGVGRPGEALDLLDEAIGLSPEIVELHLERARLRLALGRLDLARRELEEEWQRTGSPLIGAELARVLGAGGVAEAARRILARPDVTAPASEKLSATLSWGETEGSLLVARRARAHLELGDVEAARRLLEAAMRAEEQSDEARMCAAELAILDGRDAEARPLLAAISHNVPGATVWRDALEVLLDLGAGPERRTPERLATLDPSALLDHGRMLARPDYARSFAGSGDAAAGAEWLSRLKEAREKLRGIAGRMAGRDDRDVVELWRQRVVVLLEVNARRKALESASYAVHLRPGGVDERRLLLGLLDADEDAVVRYAALREAIALVPGDEQLARMMEDTERFLGLKRVTSGRD